MDKKRGMNDTSIFAFSSQNYVLFSRSYGNVSLIEEKKIFTYLAKYLKSEALCIALLHTEKDKKSYLISMEDKGKYDL